MNTRGSWALLALAILTPGTWGLDQMDNVCRGVLVAPDLCAGDQQLCPQEPDTFGCDAGNFCFPNRTSTGCKLSCPPVCKGDKIFCMGTLQSNGCMSQHVCKPRIDPITGCLNHCDLTCPEGQLMCKGVRKNCCGQRDQCCPQEPTCAEECPPQTVDIQGCPKIENQQLYCLGQQQQCLGGKDIDGCRLPNFCGIPEINDDRCTPFCPADCNLLFEMPCPPTFDLNGCKEKPTCSRFKDQCPPNKHLAHTGCPIRNTLSEGDCNPDTEITCTPDPVYKD